MQNKILLTVTVMCMCSFVSVAQIKKGALFLGGQFGIYSNTIKGDGPSYGSDEFWNGFSATPLFGIAIKENLIAGWYLIYSYANVEIQYMFVDQSRNYGSGFFMRKYKKLAGCFYLFTEANASGHRISGYHFDSYPDYNSSSTIGYNLQLSIYPGVAYSAGKRFQLEAGLSNLGYVHYTRTRESFYNPAYSPRTHKNISLGSSLSNSQWLTVGFRVLLN